MVRLDFTVNGHLVEELSVMVHNERARALAQFVVQRLKRVIEPQPFKIKIKGQGNDALMLRKRMMSGQFR